jgi:radical SAM protein (TIGR01212 family)
MCLGEKEEPLQKPAFWNNTKRYYDLKSYWRNRFGGNVYKLQIDAGFTCPNRDGKIATGGCIYCDGRGSHLRREGIVPSVKDQIRRGKEYYQTHKKGQKYIAYFQTFTNTYGPYEKLKALYEEALAQEDIIGLSIGTRPDCVSSDVLDIIKACAEKSHVWLEFGLQSIHNKTLQFINRGHSSETFIDAVKRTAGGHTLICTHIIVGLPGESHQDIIKTAETISALPIQGIKIHALLALKGTVLGDLYERGEVAMLSMDQYVQTVCDVLEILPPEMVIQRLTADGYRDIFLGPKWAINKMAVINAIDKELERRNTYQGIHCKS